MKRSMYEIDKSILDALETVEAEAFANDGVVSDDLASILDSLKIEREEKIEGVALCIKKFKVESDAHKAEIERLSKSKRSIDNSIKGCQEWLKMSLKCKNFKTMKTSVNFRKNKSVNIKNIDDMDRKYYQVKTEKIPDKKFIKWTIENIEDVAGAEIIESTSITVK